MRLFLALFLFFNAFWIRAQEPGFKNYTVEDGLPSSECYQILQDKQGYIWIATDKGLSRFDGYKFQNFTTENGLPENCVLRMYLDTKGRIWFVCLSGKMAIYENGKLKPVPINKEIVQKNGNGIINSMSMFNDTLYLGYTYSNSALRIVHKGKAFKVLKDPAHFKPGAFTRLFPNKEVSFGWIVVNRKAKKSNKLNVLFGKNHKTVSDVFDLSCAYWFKVNYFQNKLYVISDAKLNIISLRNESVTTKLFDSRLLSVKTDYFGGNTSLWIGTMKGLFYFKNHKNLTNPAIYLRGKSATDVFRDKEGGIWVATLNNGVYYAKNERVRNLFTSQKIFSLLKQDNKLILGLDHGRMVILDKNRITEHSFVENGMGYPLKGIFPVEKDHILIRYSRLSIFSLKGMKSVRTRLGFAPNGVTYEPKSNRTFLFERNGIGEYSSNTFKVIWMRNGYQLTLHCAKRLKNGKTLVGTNQGLAEYNVANNRLYFIDKNIKGLLYITESDQTIWLASKESGIRIKRKGKTYRITSKFGLTSNYCCHIYLENGSTAWVATNKGLTRIKVLSWEPFRYRCSPFTRKDGLISDELTGISEWNNKIVVAGAKGLSMIDKSKMFMPEYKPMVYLSDLLVNGKKLPVKNYYELKSEIRNLVISFRGLCFRKEGKLLYRYRLGGIGNHWQMTSNTSVEFNKVPYGKMTFEVQAQSTDGNWNTPIRKVVLFSPTPFFETTWFFMLVIGVLGSIIWCFLYWRIRLIKKRASDRERLFQKASEMELKFLTGQMNPHFTFNAMNSIQHFMLQNDLLKAQNYLTKYSKLIRKVLENNMDEYVDLVAELDLLKLYVEIESMRFSRQVDFQIDCDSTVMESYKIPPMLIQPYIENSIWHGLFDDTIKNGLIHLTITAEANALKCIITDNGIGREKARLNKKQTGKSQSLGMLITRKRLDHLNDSNLVAPVIVDLYDEHENPCGTKVVLYIPAVRK